MRKTRNLGAIIIAFLLGLSLRAMAQAELPDGPNRALVMRTCTTCHDVGLVLSTGGRTREGWSNTLEDMTSYGLEVTSQERTLILDYLATYLPPASR